MEAIEILGKLKTIISDRHRSDESEITLESKLAQDLGFDSLDEIELLMDIETEFGLSISDEQAEGIETIQQIVDSLAELTK